MVAVKKAVKPDLVDTYVSAAMWANEGFNHFRIKPAPGGVGYELRAWRSQPKKEGS